MKKYRIRLIDPVWGVPVTFIEHYAPQRERERERITSSDSAREQTGATSSPTADTTICDTSYDLLDCDSPMRGQHCTRECSFKLIGHEHDLGNGENLGQFEVNGNGVYKRILLHRL